jgi:hypothetical protein
MLHLVAGEIGSLGADLHNLFEEAAIEELA